MSLSNIFLKSGGSVYQWLEGMTVTIVAVMAAWIGAGITSMLASLPSECFFIGAFFGSLMVGIHKQVTRLHGGVTISITAFLAGSFPPAMYAMFDLPRGAWLLVALLVAILWAHFTMRLHDSFFKALNVLIVKLPDVVPEVFKTILKKLGGGK